MHEALEQARHLIGVRRWAEAEDKLGEVFAVAPNDPEAHVLAASIAYARDDHGAAREHLTQTLAVSPRHVRARWLLFHIEMEDQRYARAEALVTELIREDPDDADALAAYARLMVFTGHVAKGRELVTVALRREPDNRGARQASTLIRLVAGEGEQARAEIAELVREDPKESEALWTLFQVLVERRSFVEALEVGQVLLREQPDNEELVEALVALRVQTHWMSWPVYPMIRWGWAGSVGIWVVAIVVLRLLASKTNPWTIGIGAAYLIYVVYSWTYQPLLRRWIARRGFR